jgi:hypothetical protein
MILLILAVQLLLIFSLSRKDLLLRKSAVLPTRYALVTRQTAAPPLRETVELKDPTLFAGANYHGFSGSAWLQETEFKYVWTPEPDKPDYPPFPGGDAAMLLSDLAGGSLLPQRNDD